MPTCSRRSRASSSSDIAVISRPDRRMRPALACSRPAISSSSDVLPEPDGPTRLTVSPTSMCRWMSLRMLTRPASLASVRCTFSRWIAGMAGLMRSRLPSFTRLSLRIAAALLFGLTLCLQRADAAEPLRILAFGDSLTAGFGLGESDTLPIQLQDALTKMGRPATVINGGVSGDTTADGLARIDWALADKPRILILALGANDMLRGLDPSTARANLEGIIDKAQAAGVETILAGMLADRKSTRLNS